MHAGKFKQVLKYDDSQPRHPKGSSEGGRWAPVAGAGFDDGYETDSWMLPRSAGAVMRGEQPKGTGRPEGRRTLGRGLEGGFRKNLRHYPSAWLTLQEGRAVDERDRSDD